MARHVGLPHPRVMKALVSSELVIGLVGWAA